MPKTYTLRAHHIDALAAYVIDSKAEKPVIPKMIETRRGAGYAKRMLGMFDDIINNPKTKIKLTTGFADPCKGCPEKREECSTGVVQYDKKILDKLGLETNKAYDAPFVLKLAQSKNLGKDEYKRLKKLT